MSLRISTSGSLSRKFSPRRSLSNLNLNSPSLRPVSCSLIDACVEPLVAAAFLQKPSITKHASEPKKVSTSLTLSANPRFPTIGSKGGAGRSVSMSASMLSPGRPSPTSAHSCRLTSKRSFTLSPAPISSANPMTRKQPSRISLPPPLAAEASSCTSISNSHSPAVKLASTSTTDYNPGLISGPTHTSNSNIAASFVSASSSTPATPAPSPNMLHHLSLLMPEQSTHPSLSSLRLPSVLPASPLSPSHHPSSNPSASLSPTARSRRAPSPSHTPPMTIKTSPSCHTLSVQLPNPNAIQWQPDMVTISAKKGDRLKVVADAWHMESDCHYEWQIDFPPHDTDMSQVHATFQPGGQLVIDVKRRPGLSYSYF